jgi:outer membrane immunogenic protein
MARYRFLKIGLIAAAVGSTPVAADAADPIPAPAYRAAPLIPVIYDWTGFYVGGHAGFGWTGGGGGSGVLGGGQAGFNYQVGQWVLGVEGQVSAANIKDSVSATVTLPGFAIGTARADATVDWISTLAARAGWAFDRWLVYGKVGGAWAHVSVDAVATITAINGGASAAVSANKTSSGLMLGFGAEYVLWDNWTAKAEYNLMDFGNDFLTDSKLHVFKAGVNYRFGFGPAPAVTRY